MHPQQPHPSTLYTEHALAQRASQAQHLVVTDVDETITRKPNATTVALNVGAVTALARPVEQDNALFVVFSTGRTRLSALNWEACELGQTEMNRLRAPDVLVFENGQDAYYNAHGHKGWGDFMVALANEQHCQQHRLTCYDAVLKQYYCHQGQESSHKPPLNSAARERLLAWFKAMPVSTMMTELGHAGLPPLHVEWLERTEEHRHGLERLINTLRQQHLTITHGLHITVPVRFRASSTHGNAPPASENWVEHLVMVFLKGDAKPLLLSLGCAPASANSTGSLMPALPAFVHHTCPHTLLEQLFPLNQRSTLANSEVNALRHLVQWAEVQATRAFAYLKPNGVEITAMVQSKRLEDSVARAGTNGPRGYILLHGLVDKGKSLFHLLEALNTCLPPVMNEPFPAWRNLQRFTTLGDGNVDEALLSISQLNLGTPHSPIPNHAYVVHNEALDNEHKLFLRVKACNPNALCLQGFPSVL